MGYTSDKVYLSLVFGFEGVFDFTQDGCGVFIERDYVFLFTNSIHLLSERVSDVSKVRRPQLGDFKRMGDFHLQELVDEGVTLHIKVGEKISDL